jgi:hypothetical protein
MNHYHRTSQSRLSGPERKLLTSLRTPTLRFWGTAVVRAVRRKAKQSRATRRVQVHLRPRCTGLSLCRKTERPGERVSQRNVQGVHFHWISTRRSEFSGRRRNLERKPNRPAGKRSSALIPRRNKSSELALEPGTPLEAAPPLMSMILRPIPIRRMSAWSARGSTVSKTGNRGSHAVCAKCGAMTPIDALKVQRGSSTTPAVHASKPVILLLPSLLALRMCSI